MCINTDYNLDSISKFAVDLAGKTGELIKTKRKEHSLSYDYKDNCELVTSADIAADELISSSIKSNFPNHSIFSEESSPGFLTGNEPRKYLWIVDPVDGTVNYAHCQAHVSISIAYAIDGVVQIGVVHAPFQNETFTAIKGRGAFLNGKPIKCSTNNNLKTSIISTGFPYDKSNIEHLIRRVRCILANFQDIRRLGSAALDLCWVACGRLEGYYETIKPWDLAAGRLIAKEAGAVAGNLVQNDFVLGDLCGDDLVVAPPNIYPDLIKILEEA